MKVLEDLIDEHWAYIKALLKAHGESDDSIRVIEFHYKTAFTHGFKHGKESKK